MNELGKQVWMPTRASSRSSLRSTRVTIADGTISGGNSIHNDDEHIQRSVSEEVVPIESIMPRPSIRARRMSVIAMGHSVERPLDRHEINTLSELLDDKINNVSNTELSETLLNTLPSLSTSPSVDILDDLSWHKHTAEAFNIINTCDQVMAPLVRHT